MLKDFIGVIDLIVLKEMIVLIDLIIMIELIITIGLIETIELIIVVDLIIMVDLIITEDLIVDFEDFIRVHVDSTKVFVSVCVPTVKMVEEDGVLLVESYLEEVFWGKSNVPLNFTIDRDLNLPLFVVKFVVPSMGASIIV